MADAQTALSPLEAENLSLKIRIDTLESTIRQRDAEILHLRKFKPRALDSAAKDAFQRPA